MNKLARKLVLSVLSVVLTVVALGTTTFAWFTLTNTSVIQPFEAQIVADTGIEIAIGMPGVAPADLNFKSVITTQDVYDYMNAVYGASAFRFSHVSSINGRDFTTLEGVSTTPTGGGYLEIPFHFISDNETVINWTQVVVTSGAAAWVTGTTFVDSLGTTRVAGGSFQVDAADAVRVSVSGTQLVETAPGSGVFEPVNMTTVYENPASEPARNTVLGGNNEADFTNGGLATGVGNNGSTNYYYRVNNTLPFGADSVTTAPSETSIVSTKVLDMVTNEAVYPEATYYGVITVRIWIEGWDAEAYNSILSRIITTSLRFAA